MGNLTTVSNSVRGFTTVLLARYYTERLIEDGRASEADVLAIFLHFEQIAAYARHVGHDVESEIRGIERVKRFVAEESPRVPIGITTGAILSDQKTYGLWGLFSVPARTAGLIAEGPVGLTPYARDFVTNEYAGRLKPVERELLPLCANGGKLDIRKNKPLFRTVSSVFSPTFMRSEAEFYGTTLRDGARVEGLSTGRQASVVRLLEKFTDLNKSTGRADLEALRSRSRGDDPMLARRFERILRLEALLAPAIHLFRFLQTRNGQHPQDLAVDIAARWGTEVPNLDRAGFEAILPEIEAQVGRELALTTKRTDEALAAGNYEEAILGLLEWNRLVMQNRGAAPWLRSDSQGKLDVRYRVEEEKLPSGDDLPTLWRNSYFLDSLKSISIQLKETR